MAENGSGARSGNRKRPRDGDEDDLVVDFSSLPTRREDGPLSARGEGVDDEEDEFGPVMPSGPGPAKKRKTLAFAKLYLDLLPNAEKYERSFMHRDNVTHVLTTKTEFIITGSADGHVKFWKKQPVGIEFVKHFRSHLGTRKV